MKILELKDILANQQKHLETTTHKYREIDREVRREMQRVINKQEAMNRNEVQKNELIERGNRMHR